MVMWDAYILCKGVSFTEKALCQCSRGFFYKITLILCMELLQSSDIYIVQSQTIEMHFKLVFDYQIDFSSNNVTMRQNKHM